jgi:hypothetical protein
VDAQTRRALLTPEQLEVARLAEEEYERQVEEMRRRHRAQIDAQFDRAYRTYTTTGWNLTGYDLGVTINYDSFFDVPAPEPPPPTLNERLDAALREADRCSQRGDRLGHINALQTAAQLRRQIIRLSSATII